MNETTTADYLQLPDFPLTYPAPVSFVLRKLEMVRSELVRMINDGSALAGVVMSVNGKAPDESKNVSLAAADVPATETVDGVDVQTTVQARLDNTASRVATLEGKTVEDPLVLGKAGASQAKMSSAGGFSHVVPKTLDGTAFSDEATVSAGGVKLTSHEKSYICNSPGAVTFDADSGRLFFRRVASNALGDGATCSPSLSFPYVEPGDGSWCELTVSPFDYYYPNDVSIKDDSFSWWASDYVRHYSDIGYGGSYPDESLVVRALYSAAGAIFTQPEVGGDPLSVQGDGENPVFHRRNEVTADGVFLAKERTLGETPGLSVGFGTSVACSDFVFGRQRDGGSWGEAETETRDAFGAAPLVSDEAQYGFDLASLTAWRLLFRKTTKRGENQSTKGRDALGGISADSVKFCTEEVSDASNDLRSASMTSRGLEVRVSKKNPGRDGESVQVDGTRVEADGLHVLGDGGTIGNPPVRAEVHHYGLCVKSSSTSSYNVAVGTAVSVSGTEECTEDGYGLGLFVMSSSDDTAVPGSFDTAGGSCLFAVGVRYDDTGVAKPCIAASTGLTLRIGSSSELYLTEEKLKTLSSVLDGYSALQEKVEALEKALAGAVSATVSGDEKTLTLGTITSTETKSDAAETTAGA